VNKEEHSTGRKKIVIKWKETEVPFHGMVNRELIQILYLLSENCNTKWERNCSCIRKNIIQNGRETAVACEKT